MNLKKMNFENGFIWVKMVFTEQLRKAISENNEILAELRRNPKPIFQKLISELERKQDNLFETIIRIRRAQREQQPEPQPNPQPQPEIYLEPFTRDNNNFGVRISKIEIEKLMTHFSRSVEDIRQDPFRSYNEEIIKFNNEFADQTYKAFYNYLLDTPPEVRNLFILIRFQINTVHLEEVGHIQFTHHSDVKMTKKKSKRKIPITINTLFGEDGSFETFRSNIYRVFNPKNLRGMSNLSKTYSIISVTFLHGSGDKDNQQNFKSFEDYQKQRAEQIKKIRFVSSARSPCCL